MDVDTLLRLGVRMHVHFIVTEYRIANLYGKNLKERAAALIKIAHPDHRKKLRQDAYLFFKMKKQLF